MTKIIIPVSSDAAIKNQNCIDDFKNAGYEVATPKNTNPAVGMIAEIDLTCDAQLFMDSDIIATVDNLKSLECTGLSVVSGAYEKTVCNGVIGGNTVDNNIFVAGRWGSRPGFLGAAVANNSTGIIPVDWAGTGFLYVKTDVLKKIIEVCDNPVFFYHTVHALHLLYGKAQTSYDIGFALNCMLIKEQIYINCDCKINHLIRETVCTK
jgi:hypothetical protein